MLGVKKAQQPIVARAPLRVSFSGGGTDIEPYRSDYGGCVLAASIQLYAQAIYPSETVVPSEMEQTIIDYFQLKNIVKLTNGAPQQSGLGGSSSCYVAGIKAVKPKLGRGAIAELAFHLERNIVGITGGIQDQYCAAYGGLLYMEFGKGKVSVHRVDIPEGLEELLLLVYRGKRDVIAQDILADQISRYKRNLTTDFLHWQKDIPGDMRDLLKQGDLIHFGELLNEAWRVKLGFSPMITNAKITEFYEYCLDNGAVGGKLTGAGGGGYMLLMEHPKKKGELRQNLKDKGVSYVDVRFDKEGVCVRN